ncbi:MAG: Para-hydroxybenzoate--polyprenyltransferase, mitochondrial precursor (PHB:polyprenyltransferase) [Phylliscum demangeonii]|nr:MAG: Para-hydroxybenzoate--polyprenyltransferase, mitochondrial precursor (PHB:polyprenyltransferase) [Phylliscum demangeonii]
MRSLSRICGLSALTTATRPLVYRPIRERPPGRQAPPVGVPKDTAPVTSISRATPNFHEGGRRWRDGTSRARAWPPVVSSVPTTVVRARGLMAPRSGADVAPAHPAAPPPPALGRYQRPTTGVLGHVPAWVVPYAELARIDKPTGIYLFYLPYLFGTLFAAVVSPTLLAPTALLATNGLFLVGTAVMRGAACSWNDTIDAPYDRQVARCRWRPVARGALSRRQAHVFTALQSVVGAAILLQLPPAVIGYAVPNIALLAFYPFAKRLTHYPQVVLGLTVGWGVIMGAAAMGVDPLLGLLSPASASAAAMPGAVGVAAGALYAANVAWTVIYDTIYAHQDVRDDAAAGVKSLAVRFRHRPKPLLAALALTQVAALAATGAAAGLGPAYWVASVAGCALSLALMIRRVDLARPASCAAWFRKTVWYTGGAISAGLLLEYLARSVS